MRRDPRPLRPRLHPLYSLDTRILSFGRPKHNISLSLSLSLSFIKSRRCTGKRGPPQQPHTPLQSIDAPAARPARAPARYRDRPNTTGGHPTNTAGGASATLYMFEPSLVFDNYLYNLIFTVVGVTFTSCSTRRTKSLTSSRSVCTLASGMDGT